MEEELEFPAEDNGITKPTSAYGFFSRHNSSIVKEELLSEGKDTALGAIVSIVSAKWKSIPNEERAKYEKMAKDDKDRYIRECEIRDEEVLRQQEERRKANSVGEQMDSRVRGSTLAITDALNVKADAPKRKREVSEVEKEKIENRRQAKASHENAINSQLDELKNSKAHQAEASDIFSHFGSVKGLKSTAAPAKESTTAKSAGRRRNASSNALDEMDDDEKAMVQEVGDDDAEEDVTDKVPQNTVLLKQPSIIVGQMKNYQLEGLNWMIKLQENGINGILADEMGLGKTFQSISIIAYMREFRNIHGPHLVMVPKSTLSNWCNEFKRWCPVVRTLRFHGNKEERAEIAQQMLPGRPHSERDWDVLITTYEVVNLEKNALNKMTWKYLIIDEAHRLKNEASQFSQTVRLLNTEYRLLLTGTPLQNNLHELWALLNYLLPDVFESSEQFDDWFNLDVDDTEAKQRIIGQLHKLLRPFMLRRLKVDVEKSLPPKSETILFTGMSTIQKNLYRQVLLRDIDTINGASATNSQGSRTAILNIVMQLRKCCNHPYLFPGVEDRTMDPMGEHLYLNCGKMALLDKLLTKLKQRGHRVLIFSQMTRMLDILEDYLISKDHSYCRIDGNTTYEEREDRIYEYNREGSEKFVFILSTRAGGLGINLQTADIVILYDSDWNPQADLQAQDRAHRIGQKKPVQVFRLVTDETVEVKVVERAQQKLKLDAMVVQQGRLQEKEKKLSKQDLLDTLRFGADKIFRSKESTITDADIDLILEEGRKRTEEMNEKLQVAEKGDMYDFRLDGGMSTQVFEGKDYSDKNLRTAELNTLAGLAFIDPGKRERKAISSYAETIARQQMMEEGDKKQKLPRHLRLGKMEDWQFYDKVRLNELQSMEIKLFDGIVERGEAPQSGAIGKLVVLPSELQEEKTRLLSEAFGDWTRVHFNNFLRASAKHGRYEYEKIAKDVGRPLEESKRYSETFWRLGSVELPPAEWERVTKQIEKGEKRLEEINRLTTATSKLIMMFDDPWEELTFRNVGNQGVSGRIFNAVEDRFLLCLTNLHGFGNWDSIRNSVRRCERFRFDFYLQSCSSEALGKRCESLMKSAERELIEMEKKKSAVDLHNNTTTAPTKSKSSGSDLVKEKMADITKQITEESKRLASARSQLQKVKATPTTTGNASIKPFLEGGAKDTSSGAPRGVGSVAVPVPDELIPELITLIKAAGPDGITKITTNFAVKYPNYSKRQVELKIGEIAIKEKRPKINDKIVWYIKEEYENKGSENPKQTSNKSTTKVSSASKPSTATKRKADQDEPPTVDDGTGPKKFKRAFGFFVRENRKEAEKQLGADSKDAELLKNRLAEMWANLDEDDREPYLKMEQEDKARYERELKDLKDPGNKTSTSANKKQKV